MAKIYMVLLTWAFFHLSYSLSIPPYSEILQLAPTDVSNETTDPTAILTTNTTVARIVNNWPPAPYRYTSNGIVIEIIAYFPNPSPPPLQDPVLKAILNIQNQIYVSGKPNDRYPCPKTLSSGSVKLSFYPYVTGWITRRQAATVADVLWDLTFAHGVRGVMWARVRVGVEPMGHIEVNFVLELKRTDA